MSDVSLSADIDSSGVASGLAAIENQVQKTANSIGSYLSGAFTAGAVIAWAEKIITAAENIHREAERFQVDAEQLQTIGNAAKEIGIPLESVARALNLLEINAQKALDPSTKQALAMEHLGLSARAFADLDMQEKFLALADAYASSAKDGQAYSDVAELIGRRNTELIPLLARGRKAILDAGAAAGLMSDRTVESLATAAKSWAIFINQLEVGTANAIIAFQQFGDWFDKNVANKVRGALGLQLIPVATQAPGKTRSAQLGAGGAGPVGVTDLSPGSRGSEGSGSGGGWQAQLKVRLDQMNIEQKINELLTEREFLTNALNAADEQGDEHAATRVDIERKILLVNQILLPLQRQMNIEEQKGVATADLKIQKSQDRVAIDQLDLQISDLKNKGDEYGAFLLTNQRNLLQINLDFDEKIQKALDDANLAREKGLELTAEENEALAQQLETEKQSVLALQQQQQAQQAQRIAQGPSPLRINALAKDNLRLGATSDVYAAALAASRGLKPGTLAYNQLVLETQAQDTLLQLQGKNLGWYAQLQRDKLVQSYAAQQQQQATQAAAVSHQEELNYWGAIAQGETPSLSNPYSALFGIPNLSTGQFMPLSTASATTSDKLQAQVDLLTEAVSSLQQIQKNTTLVAV